MILVDSFLAILFIVTIILLFRRYFLVSEMAYTNIRIWWPVKELLSLRTMVPTGKCLDFPMPFGVDNQVEEVKVLKVFCANTGTEAALFAGVYFPIIPAVMQGGGGLCVRLILKQGATTISELVYLMDLTCNSDNCPKVRIPLERIEQGNYDFKVWLDFITGIFQLWKRSLAAKKAR